MARLSRLTRNRFGRRVFDTLDRLGVRLTWMCEYARGLEGAPGGRRRALAVTVASGSARGRSPPADAPDSTCGLATSRRGLATSTGSATDSARDPVVGPVTVDVCEPERVEPLGAPVEKLRDDEVVLGAFEDGRPRGYLFLSAEATDDFQPMEWPTSIDGAYIRSVYVAADHRNRGIGSALVERACRRAAQLGASRATAMVSVENGPSRSLFEKVGFEVVRDHRYVRVGPFSRLFVRER